MPTVKQRKLAKVIAENAKLDKPLNRGEMLSKVGYSKKVAKHKPSQIIQADGVKEALEELGFTEENAMKVVSEIMLNPKIKPEARLKATDQVFKVQGSYVADREQGNKTLIVNITSESAERFKLNADTT